MADSHHYIHNVATATLLAAWRSLVSFDWLEYGERGRYRQDNVQLIRDFIFSCFIFVTSSSLVSWNRFARSNPDATSKQMVARDGCLELTNALLELERRMHFLLC